MPRARSLLILVGAIVLGRLACDALVSRDRTTQATPPLQAAVLADGFAIMEAVGDRHLVEVDRNGTRRRRAAIPTVTDTRAFGGPRGAGVAWLEKKKVKVARVTGDGKLGNPSTWGESVLRMCDGLATNDHRWAVAWLEERDDRVWFVHGNTREQKVTDVMTDAEPMAVSFAGLAATTVRPSWCGMRSASDYVALVAKIDTKMFVLMCSRKDCGINTRVPIDPRDELVDIACQKDGCLAAIRTRAGDLHLGAFNLRGKVTWQKKLGYAERDTKVHLAAAGDRAYVISLRTQEGPVVERALSKNGSMGRTWHGAQDLPAPVVTWSKDHLMLAYWDGNALAHDVFAMPR